MNGAVATLLLFCLAAEQKLTDSQVDFSTTQGENGWFYGHYDGDGKGDGDGRAPSGAYSDDDFQQCTWNTDRWQGPARWLLIRDNNQHPHAGNDRGLWAVRRWVSTVEGKIRIAGNASRPVDADGSTKLHILVDGTPVFSQTLDAATKAADVDVTAAVSRGSTVDLAVDPVGGQDNDSTILRVSITLVSGTVSAPPGRRPDDHFYLKPGDTILIVGDALAMDARFWRIVEDDTRAEYPAFREAESLRAIRAGVAHETAASGRRRIASLVTRHRPTAAIVCYGISDALEGSTRSAEDLRAIVSTLTSSKVAVTLLAPLAPDTDRYPELASQRGALARYQKGVAAIAASMHCRLADAFTRAKEGWSWGDGLHPGPKGHRAIAEAIKDAWKFGEPLATDE